MYDELTQLKTAFLAKEKGFDEPCTSWLSFYDFSNEIEPTTNSDFNTEWYKETHTDFCCTQPTQSLLKKWLREIHKIDISIESVWKNEKKEEVEYIPWVFWRKEEEQEEDEPATYWNTYEQALEIALVEALNLIK